MKYKICVSGAAAGDCVNKETLHLAKRVGEEIAKSGSVLLTGATTGVPYASAVGAKLYKGLSIGFSPAASISDHVNRYRLPIKNMDVIVYTGFGYSGRNLLLTRAADAVVIICGRIGTLNEFTVAFEDKKPIGVLANSGGISDEIETIIKIARKEDGFIIYESDPEKLVDQLIRALKSKYAPLEITV